MKVSLREFLITLMDERDRRYEQRFLAQQSALEAARTTQNAALQAALAEKDKRDEQRFATNEQWRAASNEWRGTLSDRDSRFVTKEEYEPTIKSLVEKIASAEGRARAAVWGYIIGAVGLAAFLYGVLHK
jgi:hypothetical protein